MHFQVKFLKTPEITYLQPKFFQDEKTENGAKNIFREK